MNLAGRRRRETGAREPYLAIKRYGKAQSRLCCVATKKKFFWLTQAGSERLSLKTSGLLSLGRLTAGGQGGYARLAP
jgi:hypothetical protein